MSHYENDKEVKLISESLNKFTKDLYLEIAKAADGNVFFSPFSIATALSMLHMGTKGNTEAQIQSAMHLPSDKTAIKKAFQDLVTDFKREDVEYQLRTSNMAYLHHNFSVLEDYFNTLTKHFLSTSKRVDFGDSENVRQEINLLVEKETNSKIKDLIPSGVLSDLTRLVLVNAIYFKGTWVHQFKEELTKPMPFWVTADQSQDIPMMTLEKEFVHGPLNDLDASLLAMDYEGGRLRFVIILPNKRDGLSELEGKLSSVDIGSLDQNKRSSKIQVFIPKFKLEEALDMNSILQGMGMTDVFDPSECDLSDLSPEPGLFVSKVLHKAFIEVNEEGTEAAAATVAIMQLRALMRPTPPFVADHPFLFYIKDQISQNILFFGKLVKPSTI